jgi:hypothetical protein
MIARESPLEWGSSLLVALLEVQEPWFELSQRGEVIGSKDFSLDDGAIDLDLVEPAGMNRGMDQESIRPRGADTLYRPFDHDERSSYP